MENVTLERAVEVVRALTPAEQQQLRMMMDSWQVPLSKDIPAPERAFLEALLLKGTIASIPARYRAGYNPEEAADRHPPIIVQGEPVSETIIRERR